MNRRQFVLIAAGLMGTCLLQTTGRAVQAVGETITGEITASPGHLQIEIAHHLYTVKANSPADRALHTFTTGQIVDLVLDRPAKNRPAEVVSISPHSS
jgi:hypothetical protein